MTKSRQFMEIKAPVLVVLGCMVLVCTIAGGETEQNVTVKSDKLAACLRLNCSTAILNATTPEAEVRRNDSCSEHSDGWGLKGSDWGCCGNYDGCCTYASLICYLHDAMCRCCDVGNSFCGPSCKPEVGCHEVKAAVVSLKNETSQSAANLDIDKADIKDNDKKLEISHDHVTQPNPNVTVSETVQAVGSNPLIHNEYLNIEEIEKVVNSTESYSEFNLEIDELFNDTDILLNEHASALEDVTKIKESINKDTFKAGINGNKTKRLVDYLARDYSNVTANETVDAARDNPNVTINKTHVHAASSMVPHADDDYLDIEAIEKAINTTEPLDDYFDLEMESFFNETDFMFFEYDDEWDHYGSGDVEY